MMMTSCSLARQISCASHSTAFMQCVHVCVLHCFLCVFIFLHEHLHAHVFSLHRLARLRTFPLTWRQRALRTACVAMWYTHARPPCAERERERETCYSPASVFFPPLFLRLHPSGHTPPRTHPLSFPPSLSLSLCCCVRLKHSMFSVKITLPASCLPHVQPCRHATFKRPVNNSAVMNVSALPWNYKHNSLKGWSNDVMIKT